MGHGQRHGDAAGAPDAALHGCIGKTRVHEERNARLVQIVVVGQQRPGNALRGIVQIVVGEQSPSTAMMARRGVVIQDKIL